MTTQSYVDHFGYLPLSQGIDFGLGKIEPVGDISPITAQIESWRHLDGHVYPEMQHLVHETGVAGEEPTRYRVANDRLTSADFRVLTS